MEKSGNGLGRFTLAWIWVKGAVGSLLRLRQQLPPPALFDRVIPERRSRQRRTGLVGGARQSSSVRVRSHVATRTTSRV